MILNVGSTLPKFKPLRFHDGLNVVVSTKAQASNEGKTRNSAGKSSFVELIHFLLGADCGPLDLFRKVALVEHAFHATFGIAGQTVRVERSGSDPSHVMIEAETAERLGLSPKLDKKGRAWVSNTEWSQYLGHAMFGLPSILKGSPYGESYTPGYRPMFSYFARRHGSGAFVSLERQANQQRRWDWQVNLSFLLGLDWRIAHDLHGVRLREGMLAELKRAASGGALSQVVGKSAEIRPRVVLARDKAERLRRRLDGFEVVESFRELSAQAAQAKVEILAIARKAVSLKETVAYLNEAMAGERADLVVDVERLFEAVGVELPGTKIRHRLEQVAEFQKSVIANRRAHLVGEVARAEREIETGERRARDLEAGRVSILRILESGGALDDFVDLQRGLAEAEADAAALAGKLKDAEALEHESTKLDIDRAAIKLRLAANLQGERSHIDEGIILIGDAISTLYDDRVGKFEVAATDNGPEFRISIQGDGGGGISMMEFFCFDYALFVIWQSRGKGPGFLLHDSHLFDGVDPRQTLAALRLGQTATRLFGGQYVVCLNSDTIEALAPTEDIDWAEVIVQPMLSDLDDGGLFGFRFD